MRLCLDGRRAGLTNELQIALFRDNLRRRYLNGDPFLNELDEKLLC